MARLDGHTYRLWLRAFQQLIPRARRVGRPLQRTVHLRRRPEYEANSYHSRASLYAQGLARSDISGIDIELSSRAAARRAVEIE